MGEGVWNTISLVMGLEYCKPCHGGRECGIPLALSWGEGVWNTPSLVMGVGGVWNTPSLVMGGGSVEYP